MCVAVAARVVLAEDDAAARRDADVVGRFEHEHQLILTVELVGGNVVPELPVPLLAAVAR
jgi:hypothetical protein